MWTSFLRNCAIPGTVVLKEPIAMEQPCDASSASSKSDWYNQKERTSIDEAFERVNALQEKWKIDFQTFRQSVLEEKNERGEIEASQTIEKKDALIQAYLDVFNSGSKEELMGIKGIGEKKAADIMEYRKQLPFQKLEDLENVLVSTKLIKEILRLN